MVTGDGAVVALRRRRVVAPRGLADRTALDGGRLVVACDLDDRPWWIPAAAVWSDGDSGVRPEHPWHAGLEQDRCWTRAVLSGLSGRLGWEARSAHEAGVELPELPAAQFPTSGTVLDGRLGHDVPTVVVVSERAERWGSGATWASAYRRAMFGDQGTPETEAKRELADIELILSSAGIGITVVDLATALFRRAGVARVSVQLSLPSHDSVRRWDADPIQ